MNDKGGRLKRLTTGRTLRRGLTVRSGLVSVGATLAALFGLNLVIQQLQTEYRLAVNVVDQQIVETDDGCFLTIDLDLTNESERDLSVVSAGLAGVEDSDRGIIASVEVDETVPRTYRYQLASCAADAAELDADDLVVRYKLSGASRIRTTSARIDVRNSAA